MYVIYMCMYIYIYTHGIKKVGLHENIYITEE